MEYRKLSMVFILFLSMAGFAAGQIQMQDSLTVDQAVKLVVENHPAVLQASEGISSSRARVEQSKSAYYPDISGVASYSRIGPIPNLEIPGRLSEPLYPTDNYDAHLSLRQTVYDFGKRANSTSLAKSDLQTASDYVDLVKSNLSYQVIQNFYAILFLRQNIIVLDDQIAALNQHLEVTKKKVEAGTATDFDVLTTRVRIAATQSQRIDIVNALHKQENNFRQMTGVPQDDSLLLKGEFQARSVSLDSDFLILLAESQLPEAKLSKNSEETAHIQRQLASLGNRPSLNLNLQYGFKNGYFPELNTIKGNWVAGVQFQTPIFDGFRTRSQVSQAHANLNAAREHTRDIGRQITANVKQAISDVQAGQEKLATSEPQVAQAEQAVSIAEARYSAGVATNLDLLDAETSLANARLIRLRALYELVISQYALDKAVGNRIW